MKNQDLQIFTSPRLLDIVFTYGTTEDDSKEEAAVGGYLIAKILAHLTKRQILLWSKDSPISLPNQSLEALIAGDNEAAQRVLGVNQPIKEEDDSPVLIVKSDRVNLQELPRIDWLNIRKTISKRKQILVCVLGHESKNNQNMKNLDDMGTNNSGLLTLTKEISLQKTAESILATSHYFESKPVPYPKDMSQWLLYLYKICQLAVAESVIADSEYIP